MGDKNSVRDIDIVVLCGGKGGRLKEVSGDLPKALVRIAGRPFLDYLLEDLRGQGFRRIILSVGYQREKIRRYCLDAGHQVEFSVEETPLGTGGAVKKTGRMIRSPSFLVMNGDSICPVDLSGFYAFHREKEGILSFVLVKPPPGQDYGVIEIDSDRRIRSFREKKECGEGMFVNAGIYCIRRDIFDHMPKEDSFSLERDLFPCLLPFKCYGFLSDSDLLDIGTPERYASAQRKLAEMRPLRPGKLRRDQ
jgi:NDP-sugar pyrophosphorylase family protein